MQEINYHRHQVAVEKCKKKKSEILKYRTALPFICHPALFHAWILIFQENNYEYISRVFYMAKEKHPQIKYILTAYSIAGGDNFMVISMNFSVCSNAFHKNKKVH